MKKHMDCIECEHFKIISKPIEGFHEGQAVCRKNNLIVEFLNHRTLNRLKCVDERKQKK